MKRLSLSLLAFFLIHSLSFGQECGFDQKHRQRMQTDPAYAAQVNLFNSARMNNTTQTQLPIQPLKTTNSSGRTVYEIPVVVHVMDTAAVVSGTSAYSPSDTRIEEMIEYLSDAFQAQYAGHLLESNGGTFIPIQFKLAQRTPDCQPTNGIVRVDASVLPNYLAGGVGTGGVPDATLKALSVWPTTEYYNIWVVNKIDGADGLQPGVPFTAGYAYFPFPGPSTIDGTVILATQVGPGNSVITHELGHAFSLYHVFEGDNLNPPGYSCPPSAPNAGDFCADTKPIIRSLFNCPTINNCDPLLDYAFTQHNFMDYSNCKDRFTPDQRDRVWGALMDYNLVRSSLISSLGATPIASSSSMASACTPTAPPSTPTALGPRAVRVTKPGVSGDTLIFNAQSGSHASDGAQYFDRTCSHRLELVAGETYDMMVRVGGNAEYVRAYIDYDNSGTFSIMEEVFSPAVRYAQANLIGSYSFTVPSTGITLCSPIRMRVITSPNSVPGPCHNGAYGQAEDYEVIIRGPGSGATVPHSGVLTLNTPDQGNPSCLGTTNTISVKNHGSINPVSYEWYRKSASGTVDTCMLPECNPTDSFWTNNYWEDLDSVWAKVVYPGLCGMDTTVTDTIVMRRPLSVSPAVTIGVTGGSLPSCPDDTIILSVVSNVNPGSANPPYEWVKNGVSLGTNMGDELKIWNTLSGDDYYVVMTSMAPLPCALPGHATSNTISITHDQKMPTVDIAITQGTNPGCPGQMLRFEVVGQTVAGDNPTYEWQVNGIPVPGGTSTTLNTTLNDGDKVHVMMTSSSACALLPTVSSDTITYTESFLTPEVSVVQTAGKTPLCSGLPASFEALPVNGGTNPLYQWMVNQTPVPGANGLTFTSSTLANNDELQVIMISNDPCVLSPADTSDPIVITTQPSFNPSVSIALVEGDNPGCLDSMVKLQATVNDFGSNPLITWHVNGFGSIFTGPDFESSAMQDGDVVTVRVTATDAGCYLPDTVFSNSIVMIRSLTPEPPVISLIGNMLYTDKPGSYTWFGPGGKLTGSTIGEYHPGELGTYWAKAENNGCFSPESNRIRITLLDIQKINLSSMRLFPNPTKGLVTLQWGQRLDAEVTVSSLVGQTLLQFKVEGAKEKTLDLGTLANGTYLLTVQEANGATATHRVTLNR